MANRFERSAPVEWSLPKTPLQPLMYALEQKQKRYDVSYELADQLADQQIQALQKDRAQANTLTRGWNERIDDMVTKYDGDYSRMYKDLGSLKRDIKRTMTAGGEGAAIQTNYANYQNWLAEQRKRVGKDITQAQLQKAADYYLKGYGGVGTKDPVTGTYNLFQPDTLAKYVNPDKELHAALQKIAADEGGEVKMHRDGLYIYKDGKKWEKIDPARIQNITAQTLMGNQEYLNYISQAATHAGLDPSQVLQEDIVSRATNMANIYRKDNVWLDRDMKGDTTAMSMMKMNMFKDMLSPEGPLMPDTMKNTGLNKFKIGYREGLADGERVLPYTYSVTGKDKSARPGSATALISSQKTKLRNQAPALEGVFDDVVAIVSNTQAYKKADEATKQQMIETAFNNRVDKAQTYNSSTVAFTSNFLKGIDEQWDVLAGRAYYQKVNADGSLGKVQQRGISGYEPEELRKQKPAGIKVQDGKIALEYNIGGEQYMVTNTGLDDKAQKLLEPVLHFQAPYMGGQKGNLPWQGQILTSGGTAPSGSRMEVTLAPDMSRVGIVKDASGNVIDQVPEAFIKQAEATVFKQASGAMPRSSDFGSNYLLFGDSQGQWDELNPQQKIGTANMFFQQ